MRIETMGPEHTDAICALWNRELASEFPMRERVFRQSVVEHADFMAEGSFVVRETASGRVLGAIACKRPRGGSGHITLLLVTSEIRRIGIGSSLLALAENALSGAGAIKVSVGGDSGHLFPGSPSSCTSLNSWLEHKGYTRRGQMFDLLGDFTNVDPNGLITEIPGIVCRTADAARDKDHLLGWMKTHFPGRWEETAGHYFAQGGTGREYVLMWAREEAELIGFCRVNDTRASVLVASQFWTPLLPGESGGIGPLGIASAFRGKGLGKHLLGSGIRELLLRGVRHIVIDWTDQLDFYAKYGFKAWKAYEQYKKEFTHEMT